MEDFRILEARYRNNRARPTQPNIQWFNGYGPTRDPMLNCFAQRLGFAQDPIKSAIEQMKAMESINEAINPFGGHILGRIAFARAITDNYGYNNPYQTSYTPNYPSEQERICAQKAINNGYPAEGYTKCLMPEVVLHMKPGVGSCNCPKTLHRQLKDMLVSRGVWDDNHLWEMLKLLQGLIAEGWVVEDTPDAKLVKKVIWGETAPKSDLAKLETKYNKDKKDNIRVDFANGDGY